MDGEDRVGTSQGGTSRGEFIKRTAGVTGLAIGAGIWTRGALAAPTADAPPDADAAAAAAAAGRAFTGGHFALELDGAKTGFLQSVEGGGISADVVVQPAQEGSFYQRKHIGNVKYEEIAMRLGLSMSSPLNDWITAMWQGNAQRKDGAIVSTDFQFNAKARREFSDAIISEVTIPTLDGSAKEAAYLTVKLAPEQTKVESDSGKVTIPAGKQKAWLASNFKVEIDGLDTKRVTKVDAFTVKQGVAPSPIGDDRELEPTTVEFPNLTFTLAQIDAQSWYDWFDDFVLHGNNGQEKERSGKLIFLAPNLTDELGRVDLFNLGIFRLAPEPSENNANQPARVKVELYCERMEFHVGSSKPA